MKKLVLFCLSFAAATLSAADPYIGYTYPAGAQQGSKVRVLLGGQYMYGRKILVSGTGVTIDKITPVPGFPNPDGRQRRYLIDKLKHLKGKGKAPVKPADAEMNWRKNRWWEMLEKLDELELSLVTKNLLVRVNSLQAAPSLRQMVIVDISVAPDAPCGPRELRISGSNGLSNPKTFFISKAPELNEPRYTPYWLEKPANPLADKLPFVFNGQILPGETDRFDIKLKAGQPLRCRLLGRMLQPYIGDAVPGFFQPVLELFDADGRCVAYADDKHFDPDPDLYFTAPQDGIYTLAVRDNLYRGREDFVYRVELSSAKPAPASQLVWSGSKLPQLKYKSAMDLKTDWQKGLVIAGALTETGSVHRVELTGRRGDLAAFTLAARALGSPLDGVLTLYAADGKTVIARNDDKPLKWNVGLIPQALDAQLLVCFPADGKYILELRELTNSGGKDYNYLLKCAPPQGDFQIYSGTSSLNIPSGSTQKIKFYIERFDGFAGPIVLRSLTEGLEIVKGSLIPGDAASFEVTVRNKRDRRAPLAQVKFMARTRLMDDTLIEKAVIPADTYMQAFAYDHLVPAQNWYLQTLPPRRPPRKVVKPPVKPRTAPAKTAPAKAAPAAKK